MHLNYHFLKQLAPELHERLAGRIFAEGFSQEKDEIVLVFEGKDEAPAFFIKAILHADFSCLTFPDRFDRARKNSVNLFSDFEGKTVGHVRIFENERAIEMKFEDDTALIFKMFGNRSNLVALDETGNVIQLFNNRLALDRQLNAANLDRRIDQSKEAFELAGHEYKKLFPTLGKVAIRHLDYLLENVKSAEEQWNIVSGFVQEINRPPFFLTKLDALPALTLFETGEVTAAFDSPMEAINAFYLAFTRVSSLEREKAEISRLLKKRIQQTVNYLENTFSKLVALEEGLKHDEIGNLIMANLHNIPPRAEQAKIFDFYRNLPIVIKLKKDLSAQKNAEIFYRKAKNEKIELARLNDSLAAREQEKVALEAHLAHIETLTGVRELRVYIKTNQLIQTKTVETAELFKKVEFLGYAILIGRNAKNNDLLTKQYATRDDIWLHAKDVTGSHVVIKNQPGKKTPAPVIERAAELAAWYSRRKNDSLCPVIYTPKKFVRKPKGLPEGAVVIDKENVIMVPAKGE